MSPARASGFDGLALSYDRVWTHTGPGRLQREAFWRAALPLFAEGTSVLDLGCGTGEDAEHFGQKGVQVLGIDNSPEMVQLARQRGVDARVLRIEDIGTLRRTFDGAISNFGAINCVERLCDVREPLARLIRSDGHLVLCVMGRFCVWESLWFGLRGAFGKAARRWGGKADSSLGIRVYYPTVNEIEAALRPEFRLMSVSGAGVFVPPSQVGALPERLLRLCGRIDRKTARWPLFRAIGDHRILVFRRIERGTERSAERD
jgi:SAM-dependent methyltransferase